MATTAFHSVGLERLRRSEDRFARPAFSAMLASWVQNWRTAHERRVMERFAGCRWCDSIERQLNDALGGSAHTTDLFER